MDPFAYQKPKNPGRRKLLLMGLAVASFSIWYFDLFPELSPVPTGELDPVAEDTFSEDDFLELLKANPDAALASTDDSDPDAEPSLPSLEDDPLAAALAAQADPPNGEVNSIEAAFPEFGQVVGDEEPPVLGVEGNHEGVVQASFEVQPPQNDSPPQPKVLAPEVADQLRKADDLVAAGDTLQAHAALSRLYWKQPDLRSEIRERIEKTAAEIYANPTTHFAEPRMVEFGETLDTIAQEYKVPWQYLARLNRTTPETLQAGQKLKVLTGPFGAVIDLEKFEMTVHAHGWFVRRYTIGIGADGGTPIGKFTVQNKLENPVWYNPDGGVVSADDPNNPLGEYWLGLGNHIGIHGTIDPDSIGSATSSGCIHLADGDIAEIFQLLGPGSPVDIRR